MNLVDFDKEEWKRSCWDEVRWLRRAMDAEHVNEFEDFVCKLVAPHPTRFPLKILGRLDLVILSWTATRGVRQVFFYISLP